MEGNRAVFLTVHFSIFLSLILSDAFTDFTQGVWIESKPGANLFNASQFKFVRKTKKALVCKLTLANTAFMVHNHQGAPEIITYFLESAKAFGLKINLKKTKVIYQPFPGSHDIGQDIQRAKY